MLFDNNYYSSIKITGERAVHVARAIDEEIANVDRQALQAMQEQKPWSPNWQGEYRAYRSALTRIKAAIEQSFEVATKAAQ